MEKRLHSGFTLTEVLVSVFVLAVGVIGVAGMQLSALRTVRQSAFQTAAVELASDIAEAIRADAESAEERRHLLLGIDYAADAGDPPAPETICFNAARCDPRQLARFDIYQWEKRLREALPSGRVRVCRDDAPWDGDARAFRWACSDSGAVVVKVGWLGRDPDGALRRDGKREFPPAVVLAAGGDVQ